MALEFFWVSGSCNSWRVALALEIKRVPYESRLLQISKREHKSADYLAINPRGKVPAIRDGAFTLYESLAIVEYLDRRFPEPPLIGRAPEEAGRTMRQALELIFYFEPILDRVAVPIYGGKAAENADSIRAAADELRPELSRLEAAVSATPFLVGDAVSVADCTAFPFIQQLLRAAGKEAAAPLALGFLPFDRTYPALAAWIKRIEALPGYARTYPPHWR